MDLHGQHIAILGAGRSGLGAAKLARKHGATCAVFDEGDPAKLAKAIADLNAAGFDCSIGLEKAKAAVAESHFDLCVTSPGLDAAWPLPRVFTDAGVPLIGEMEFA